MKQITLLIGLVALSIFFCTACDPAVLLGPQASQADKYDLRIRYHRGSCYGRCEVYALNVYENGLLVFEGQRFTDRPGTWEKSIDRRRVTSLLDSFARADFPNYPRSFRGQVADAATISMTYYDAEGTMYKTSFKDSEPPELELLSKKLHDLAHLPNYRQVSDTIVGRKNRVKNRISPNSPYYIITADPNIMGAEELLEFLRQDKDVVSAQLNNAVGPR